MFYMEFGMSQHMTISCLNYKSNILNTDSMSTDALNCLV